MSVHYFAQCQLGGDPPRDDETKKKNGKSTFVFTGQRNLIYWKLGKPFVYWLSASVTQHTNTTHFLTISSLHLLGYCVRRPAAVDSKEFACCLVPWRERKSSPFLSLNWEWHWLDDLRGVERQKKKKSWKFTWTQFFFFFFFLKDFLFFLNWWRGLSGRLWEAHKKERKGSAQLRVEFVIRRYWCSLLPLMSQ